jgi:hypothetical protein
MSPRPESDIPGCAGCPFRNAGVAAVYTMDSYYRYLKQRRG